MKIASGLKHLLIGGFGAHIISLAAYPIVSRLFTPTSFGQYAVYANIIGLTSIVACARMDAAIALQTRPSGIAGTALIGLVSVVILTMVAALLLGTSAAETFLKTLGILDTRLIWLLPISLLLIGLIQLIQALALRNQSYKDLGKARFTQSLAQLTTQIIAGLFDLRSFGLAISFIAGQILGYSSIINNLLKESKTFKRAFKAKRLLVVARTNLSFASYSIPSSLLLASTPMMPSLILNYYSGPTVAGLYFFSAQIISQSLSIFRRSLAQYIIGEGQNLNSDRYKKTLETTKKTLQITIAVFTTAWLAFTTVDTYIITKIFGNHWTNAAVYFSILLPMYMADIIGYAYTQVLLVKKAHRLQMAIDTVRSLVVLGSMVMILANGLGATLAVAWYSISMTFFYALITCMGHIKIKE